MNRLTFEAFRGLRIVLEEFYGICLKLIKKDRKMSTCDRWLELGVLGPRLIAPKNLPGPMPGKFVGTGGRDPSDSKPNRLHVVLTWIPDNRELE